MQVLQLLTDNINIYNYYHYLYLNVAYCCYYYVQSNLYIKVTPYKA